MVYQCQGTNHPQSSLLTWMMYWSSVASCSRNTQNRSKSLHQTKTDLTHTPKTPLNKQDEKINIITCYCWFGKGLERGGQGSSYRITCHFHHALSFPPIHTCSYTAVSGKGGGREGKKRRGSTKIKAKNQKAPIIMPVFPTYVNTLEIKRGEKFTLCTA